MPNKKTKPPFNAAVAVVMIARKLMGSGYNILGCYDPSLAILGEDERRRRRQFNRCSCNQQDGPVKPVLTGTLKNNINQLSSFLGTKPIETLLFVAIFVYHNSDDSMQMCDICNFFDFQQIHFLPLKKILESLIQKELVKKSDDRYADVECYDVTRKADEAITNNIHFQNFRKDNEKTFDRYDFCENVFSLIERHSCRNITTRGILNEMQKLETKNRNMPFVKNTLLLLPQPPDRLVFYDACHHYLHHSERISHIRNVLPRLFDDVNLRRTSSMTICGLTNDLVKTGLIKVLKGSGPYGDEGMLLTEKGKKLFFEDNYKFFKEGEPSEAS